MKEAKDIIAIYPAMKFEVLISLYNTIDVYRKGIFGINIVKSYECDEFDVESITLIDQHCKTIFAIFRKVKANTKGHKR